MDAFIKERMDGRSNTFKSSTVSLCIVTPSGTKIDSSEQIKFFSRTIQQVGRVYIWIGGNKLVGILVQVSMNNNITDHA